MNHFKTMIVGEAPTAGQIEVTAPFDQSPIATIETSDEEAVNVALESAYTLFRDRSQWLPIRQRIAILEKMIALMGDRAELLAIEAAREGGKPLIDSRVEVARAIDSLRICVDCLRTEGGETIPMGINAASEGKMAFTTREPIGVVVAVSAFNHPLNLISHQVGPAIAAGCPVIVKPAESTPLSCFRFVEIAREAGLPEAWCQAVVPLKREVSTQLVSDSRVAFLSFIGSARVGWMLRSKLTAGARCALEHGGAAPVIVAEDADLDELIPKLLKGGFYHAGQVCVSVQRVFIHHAIAREVALRLAEGARSLVIGDPTQAETEIGPLIRPQEVERVQQWVDEAVTEGAELLAGGRTLSPSTFECTVLYSPSAESKVSRQEIFGPVICLYPYGQIEDAVTQANALPYAFQAALFSTNIDTATYAYKNLDASAVMINDHTAFRVDWMPFAGLRQSGLGVGGIPYTLRDMQIEKMMVLSVS
ncbi:MAG: aldehyde dehydrogenase family protein [Gammaproteobacteria bacterium]|jgi:acyl-CoA reductase-like NAD-dependent aldehyde dehydrogenase|nr:aldehyde dehydrogenase family protein [Gammaproteobacteria bacterium]MBT7307973.1 aldehyde dehydrogenase family protein [Gammaproteobacteria bacterium]